MGFQILGKNDSVAKAIFENLCIFGVENDKILGNI
jgi:hypothetical protein